MTVPVKIRQSKRERERTRGWGNDGNKKTGTLTVLDSHYDHIVST